MIALVDGVLHMTSDGNLADYIGVLELPNKSMAEWFRTCVGDSALFGRHGIDSFPCIQPMPSPTCDISNRVEYGTQMSPSNVW